MNVTDTPTVFIVDDDASVREGMAWLLRTRRLLSESFDSAEAFVAMVQGNGASEVADDGAAWQPNRPCCSNRPALCWTCAGPAGAAWPCLSNCWPKA